MVENSQSSGLSGNGGGQNELWRDLKKLSESNGIFHILTRVWITQRCAFVKTQRMHISDLCMSLCINVTSQEKKNYTQMSKVNNMRAESVLGRVYSVSAIYFEMHQVKNIGWIIGWIEGCTEGARGKSKGQMFMMESRWWVHMCPRQKSTVP